MSAHCCHHSEPAAPNNRHRRVLWAVLAINVAGFVGEMAAGLIAGSASLQADALDFLSDAANYAISLTVLGLALRWRAIAALAKGLSMALFGIWVIGSTAWYAIFATVPRAELMGIAGFLALGANMLCLVILRGFGSGDANMRSVWLCSRNDVIGNVAVIIAASGVFVTESGWPDLVVAAIMAVLAISSSVQVIRQARAELRSWRRLELSASSNGRQAASEERVVSGAR